MPAQKVYHEMCLELLKSNSNEMRTGHVKLSLDVLHAVLTLDVCVTLAP